MVGQSQGEIIAACVAGALSVEDAARVIGLSAIDIGDRLGQYQGQLEIAGVIGPRTVTVAGAVDALKDLEAQLKRCSVLAKIIPASIPSHCFRRAPT